MYWCHGSIIGFFLHPPSILSTSRKKLILSPSPMEKLGSQDCLAPELIAFPPLGDAGAIDCLLSLGVESSTPLGQVGWNLLNQPVWRFVVNNLIFHHVFLVGSLQKSKFSKTLKGCVTFLLGIEGMMKYSKLFIRQFCVLKLL